MTSTHLQRAGIGLMTAGALFVSLISPGPIGWLVVGAGAGLLLLGGGRPVRTPVDWSLAVLLLMGGVTLLVTADPSITRGHVSRLLAGFVAFYGVVSWSDSDKALSLAAGLLVALGVALAAVAPVTVDWLAPQAKLLPESLLSLFPTLVADTIHPNVMASALIIVLPLAAAWWLAVAGRRTDRLRLLLGGSALMMAAVFVLTQSRGGLVGLVCAAIVVVGALYGWRWGGALALLSVAGVAALLLWGGSLSAPVVQGTVDTSTLAFRLDVWRIAIWMSSEFAFTGAGMGTFNETALRLYPFSETANPGTHSWYLQLAVELGLPGLVAFLALLVAVVWMGVVAIGRISFATQPARYGRAVGALAALLGLIVHGLVDNTVWGTRATVLPWILMGLITATFLLANQSPQAAPQTTDERR